MEFFDLDVTSPKELPLVLRRAADVFHEYHERLKVDRQDPNAGLMWAELAQILERAAADAEDIIWTHE